MVICLWATFHCVETRDPSLHDGARSCDHERPRPFQLAPLLFFFISRHWFEGKSSVQSVLQREVDQESRSRSRSI